ncbi:hypothetical protein IMCC3317_09500 [Kordia antarctica]|uniref:Uncharacterized protein n=1 Tax=Kordia antarctica TaxID=1218801 RepID=A0A7L4ZI53_9FLAO|nr:hypothetical protein [Kordia antarctica]QHI35604.1 hypothetical protein IMCC3317_09500 [Kordia antarctica]
MKLFITLFSLIVLATNPIGDTLEPLNDDVITYNVVFDGNEGGAFFHR